MPTLSDIAQISGNTFVKNIFDAVRASTPILSSLETMELTSDRYLSLAMTELPTAGGFRDLNQGAPAAEVGFKMGDVHAKLIKMLVRTAKGSTDLYNSRLRAPSGAQIGTDWFTLQTQARLKAENLNLEKCLIYGTAQDAKSFPGFKQLTSTAVASNTLALTDDAAASAYVKAVVNMGGSTSNVASSVYSVCEGELDVHLKVGGLDGMAGFLSMSEIVEQYDADTEDSTLRQLYYLSSGQGYVGLSVMGSDELEATRKFTQYSLRRLCNIPPLVPLTDAAMDALFESHPDGHKPTKYYMSMRSRKQLQASRTAGRTVFVAGGTTAQNSSFSNLGPLPTEHNGVPIIASEWILNTEAIETPA